MAVPIGPLGAKRHPGLLLRGGLRFGSPARVVRFRLDVDGAFMSANSAAPDFSSATGGLRTLSVAASILVSARTAIAPFATVGIAAHHLTVRHYQNPYGTAPGLRASVGVQRRVGRVGFTLEAGAHLLVTDFGTGRDFSLGRYLPLQLAFTF